MTLRGLVFPNAWRYRDYVINAFNQDLPFDQFTGYRIGKKLDLKHLERIGLVAIGRAFTADLCFAQIGLYRDTR